jgi:hypothetical protein
MCLFSFKRSVPVIFPSPFTSPLIINVYSSPVDSFNLHPVPTGVSVVISSLFLLYIFTVVPVFVTMLFIMSSTFVSGDIFVIVFSSISNLPDVTGFSSVGVSLFPCYCYYTVCCFYTISCI